MDVTCKNSISRSASSGTNVTFAFSRRSEIIRGLRGGRPTTEALQFSRFASCIIILCNMFADQVQSYVYKTKTHIYAEQIKLRADNPETRFTK